MQLHRLAMQAPSADGVGAWEAWRSRGGSLGPLMSRGRVAAASLVILGWVAVASAEDTPKAPAGTRSLADTPFQLVLPSEHLLGDWFGARAWLEEHGVTPTVTFVTDALANPTGGMRQGFRGASNLGLDLLVDLEKLFGLVGGSFHRERLQRAAGVRRRDVPTRRRGLPPTTVGRPIGAPSRPHRRRRRLSRVSLRLRVRPECFRWKSGRRLLQRSRHDRLPQRHLGWPRQGAADRADVCDGRPVQRRPLHPRQRSSRSGLVHGRAAVRDGRGRVSGERTSR